MAAVGIAIIYALFALTEVVFLKKTKRKKELIAFIVFLSAAFVLSMLLILGVKFTSVEKLIWDLYILITKEP